MSSKRWWWTVAAVVLLLVVVGCGREEDGGQVAAPTDDSVPITTGAVDEVEDPSSGGTAGDAVEARRTLEVDGLERSYLVYAPASLPATGPVPVVLYLHGGIGSGEQLAGTAHVREHAEQDGYLAVLPDGTTNADGRFRTWNGGRCCGPAAANDVDDVAFLAEVLDEVAEQWDVDPDRVFAAGHSNGAIMANRLACELPDRVAAIGVVAGSLEVGCEDATPTSVLYVHGDADTNHPLGGGEGEDSVAGVDFTSVADSLDVWVEVDGCDPVPEEERAAEITTSRWSGCDDGTAVELQVIHGAPHAWPGGERTSGLASEPSGALDATAAVWAFFEQHPRS
jgi:polyhydroxybutyrate depolymerase